MDIGEFYAGVYYGNTRKWVFKDKELEKAVYRAFNTWALEVCAYDPDRLIVLPMAARGVPGVLCGRGIPGWRDWASARGGAEPERHGGRRLVAGLGAGVDQRLRRRAW